MIAKILVTLLTLVTVSFIPVKALSLTDSTYEVFQEEASAQSKAAVEAEGKVNDVMSDEQIIEILLADQGGQTLFDDKVQE